MVPGQEIGEWHRTTVLNRDGERTSKPEDIETNEPMFVSLKELVIGHQVAFVPPHPTPNAAADSPDAHTRSCLTLQLGVSGSCGS